MPDRRSFLTKLGVTSLLLASSSAAAAQAVPDATPAPAEATPASAPLPSPSASASASAKKSASAVAVALAASMRRFDPKLDDAELAIIAASIDDDLGAGAVLNPKKNRLKNSDEPVTRFAADDR